MTPDRLAAHFDRVANAPDAVPRIRQFILDLAVRGKLVEQNSREEPASDLLTYVHAEKARLVKVGELRKEQPLPPIDESNLPFNLPKGWVWARLGDLSRLVTSGSRDWAKFYSVDGAVFVRMGNLSRGSYQLRLDSIQRVEAPTDGEGARTKLEEGDILISITGEVGLLGLVPPNFGEAYINQHVCLVRPMAQLRNRFLPELFRSPFAQNQFNEPQRGIKNSFRLTDVTQLVVPLPPLAEQSRIVAKVDELMALCDRLEAVQTERESRRDRLAVASLQRLNQPVDAPAFREHARFHLSHLPRITTRPEQIPQLRQAILSLAVHGQLVAQDPNDEPASALLSRIKTQRTKLLEQGYPNPSEAASQRKKQVNQCIPEGLGSLPPGWEWATLMQCSVLVVDCHNKTAPYSSTGIILLRTTNVRDGKLNLNEPRFVDEETYIRWSARCQPAPGDILITREAPMGEVCQIPDDMKVCLGQRMMLARLMPKTIDTRFLVYSLRDPRLMDRVQDKPVGATVQHLRVGGVETLLVPLPPLPEQRRIVAKVEELMSLCDRLEAQLTTTQTQSRLLLESVLHEALASA